jgi:phospholipid/cholesterol/gamma-HCH transport system substrate-binding protein
MRMRFLMVVVVLVIATGVFFVFRRPVSHRLEFKCYFRNAQGLRADNPVDIAGVQVGSVTSVRVRPELPEYPAEVVMSLDTPYELKVPNDSVVSVEMAGLLGGSFAQIDVRGATGSPLQPGGILKTRDSEAITPQQWVDCFSNLVDHKPCDLRARNSNEHPPTSRQPAR